MTPPPEVTDELIGEVLTTHKSNMLTYRLALEVRRLREENANLTRDLDLARHGAYRGGPVDGEE